MGRSEPFATSLQEQYTLRLFCSLRSKTARKVLRSSMHSLRSPAAHSIFKNPREMDSMPVRLWRGGLGAGGGCGGGGAGRGRGGRGGGAGGGQIHPSHQNPPGGGGRGEVSIHAGNR